MKNNIEPTEKQKRAFKEVVEMGRNKGDAMINAGYSENTAKAPTKMTKSKGWQQLMEKYLPDDDLAKVHQKLLKKQEIVVKNNNKTGKIEVIKTGELDAQAVGRGLDMAYKLKGRYSATKIKIIDDNEDFTDEQIEEELAIRQERRKLGKKFDNKGKTKSS